MYDGFHPDKELLESVAKFREAVHSRALSLVKKQYPEINEVIDQYPAEEYFLRYWDAPGRWFYRVDAPEAAECVSFLIEEIVENTIKEHFRSKGIEYVKQDNIKIQSYVSSLGGVELDPDDPDYVAIDPGKFDISCVTGKDDLGRELYISGKQGNCRQVALFYNTNHYGWASTDIFQDTLDQGMLPAPYHIYWWGLPLLGMYQSDDEWVLRKHIEMFIYAGIDFLVFDTTNGFAYPKFALKLMELLHEYNVNGWDAPKVVFYTNTDSPKTDMEAFTNIYEKGLYPDTWYMVDGKPLIISRDPLPVINEFFTVRYSQWPNEPRVEAGFPWIDFSDVASIYYDKDGRHGVMPVSVAQNSSPDALFSDNVLWGMKGSEGGSRGRSWHDGDDNITESSYKYGYNFQEEWDRAIDSDAETAMVLQWNEWRARVFECKGRPAVYDEFTNEYSRDIEPMQGGHFDNYYLQLVDNVRRFKNSGGKTVFSGNITIDINGPFGQWNQVSQFYADMPHGNARRDADSISGERLTDNTGRNSLIGAKVCKDAENVYFYVLAGNDILTETSGTWMNLFIDTDGDLTNNWNGYEFRVNNIESHGKLRFERYNGSYFEKAAEVPYRILGNQMMLSIRKGDLGISGDDFTINFKWADSTKELESYEDFYRHGDTMPYGRFNYTFNCHE